MSVNDRIVISTIYTQIHWYFTKKQSTGEYDEFGDEGIDYYNGAFAECGFTCELVIPDNVEIIRGYAFDRCKGLYGSLRLPSKLKRLGARAFFMCMNLTGSLEIPQGVTNIPEEAFSTCGFDGTLLLHDGIMSIGTSAFSDCNFKGELALPKTSRSSTIMCFIIAIFPANWFFPKILLLLVIRHLLITGV